jgi:hypothetical protein
MEMNLVKTGVDVYRKFRLNNDQHMAITRRRRCPRGVKSSRVKSGWICASERDESLLCVTLFQRAHNLYMLFVIRGASC